MSNRKLYAQDIRYIDPADAGSAIGYRIRSGYKKRSVSSDLDLADCERSITWHFYVSSDTEHAHALKKIAAAITMLQNFRADLLKSIQKARG